MVYSCLNVSTRKRVDFWLTWQFCRESLDFKVNEIQSYLNHLKYFLFFENFMQCILLRILYIYETLFCMCLIQCFDLICAPVSPLQALPCPPCFFLLCSVSLCVSNFCVCMDVAPCTVARVVSGVYPCVSNFCTCMDVAPCTVARVVFQESIPEANEFSFPSSR